MPTLTIIRGASGSGKTTLAELLSESRVGWFHFEADMFFINERDEYHFDASKLESAHEWCKAITESFLRAGSDVIVSNTFTKVWEMEPYLEMVSALGCKLQVIHCQSRFDNVHGVPEKKVQQMRDNFEEYRL